MSLPETHTPSLKNPSIIDPGSTTHKSVWEKCPFLKILSKVWKAVCGFFKKIADIFKPSPYVLTQRDLEYIKDAKNRYRPSPIPSPSQDLQEKEIRPVSNKELPPEEINNEEDDVYRDFRKAGLTFIDNAVKATYTEKVEPLLPTVQGELGKLKEYLNFGADVVITIGQGIKTPLEEKFIDFKVAEQLKPDMLRLVKWLVSKEKPINQEWFLEELKKRIGNEIEYSQRELAIEHCRKWLFENDFEAEDVPPLITPGTKFIEQKALERVFKDAVAILAEERIAQFDQKVQDNLNKKLPDIIQELMEKNGQKIGKIVINRLIEILDKAPFAETFDDIIALLADQSSAVIKAEQVGKDEIAKEKALIDLCEKASLDSPQRDPRAEQNRQDLIGIRAVYIESSRELWVSVQGENAYKEALKIAKEHIQDLESKNEIPEELTKIREQGVALWIKKQANDAKKNAISAAVKRIDSMDKDLEKEIEDEWLKSIGENAARESYRKFLVNGKALCHEKIHELDLVQDEIENNAPKQNSGGIENVLEILMAMLPKEDESEAHLFDTSAKRLMDLLFPPVEVKDLSGNKHTVDGLLYLLDQIDYGEELKEIYNEAAFIYREVLTDEKHMKIAKLLEENHATLERCVLKLTKTKTKDAVSQAIASLYQQFIVPQKIDELMAYTTLPALQETMVSALARSTLSYQLKNYAPLFQELVTAEDGDRDVKREKIIRDLSTATRQSLHSYDKDNMSDEKLHKLVEEQIIILEAFLSECFEKRTEQEGEDQGQVFLSFLEKYFETHYYESNPRYGDLVVNTAFKMGKLNGKVEYFADWFKGSLSREISAATHDMRESPHYLLEKATEQINVNYSSEEKVKELLYNKTQELKTEETEKHLQQQLEKTAKIAHDLLYYNASQQGFVARNAIKYVIGSNHELLNGVISRVYHQMLGNTLYTQNLMVRFQEKFSDLLIKGAENAAKSQTSLPIVKRPPSLVPSFVYHYND